MRRSVLRTLTLLTLLACPRATVAQLSDSLDLPTPLEHYENFDAEAYGQTLLLQVAAKLPAEDRAKALSLFTQAKATGEIGLSAAEVREALESIEWREYRPSLLRLLLHRSRALEVIPSTASEWLPMVHDALLFFLERLSEERLLDRLAEQVRLPQAASRGERVLAFIENTPSLQKLAQILARNPDIDSDLRAALQTMESGVVSVDYEDILGQIREEMPPEVRDTYHVRFADELLAEASVGAIVVADFQAPGAAEPGRAACKVLKPKAVAALKEDLVIIDQILAFLEANAAFYGLGATPLVDIFEELREALSREVRVEDERTNLIRAGAYYASDPAIVVPALYPFSTPNVTCMEFIPGSKITDAFSGRPSDRAALAKRLSDALTFDVLFSREDVALFHGDPHAGNVFHVPGREDPYTISLIDWGLAAEFDRREREKLVQLMLGLRLKHAKRLANNVDVLVEWDPRTEDERDAMRERMEGLVSRSENADMFVLLDELVQELASDGLSVRFNAAIFIKSQLTIAGILSELDPTFEQDAHVMGRISGQVAREIHVRLLRTVWFPAWNSHSYASMMSNEDVKDVQFQKIGHGFKVFGKAIWSGITFGWLRGGNDDDEG